MDPSDLVEIEKIKQLKARYFRLMDEKQWEAWGECFTEDATLDTREDGAPLTHGRDAIRNLVRGAVDAAITVHAPLGFERREQNHCDENCPYGAGGCNCDWETSTGTLEEVAQAHVEILRQALEGLE